MQKIQAALTRFSINSNFRRLKNVKRRAKGLARCAPVATPNCRRHARRHPNSNDESKESDKFELDADLPIMRQGDREEYCVKANIPPFNGNLPIKETTIFLSKDFLIVFQR